MQSLVDGINAQGLPSYAGGGVKWVERGALATMETREDEIRRMRRAAIFVQRILHGRASGLASDLVRAAAGVGDQHGDRQGDWNLAALRGHG